MAESTFLERAAATAKQLQQSATAAGIFVTADLRLAEADLARLLGYAPETLRKMRAEGRGPPAFNVGLNGCRISYRLAAVATWIESNVI